jgi:hypothetical protein
MKNAAKVIEIICVAAFFASFVLSISFYYRDLPNRPQPEHGRTYPINNHGYLLYLTKEEHLQQIWSFALFVGLFAVAAVIDHFFDPFDRRRRHILATRRAPWNHRWGP